MKHKKILIIGGVLLLVILCITLFDTKINTDRHTAYQDGQKYNRLLGVEIALGRYFKKNKAYPTTDLECKDITFLEKYL